MSRGLLRTGIAVALVLAMFAIPILHLPYGKFDFLDVANSQVYTTATPTATPTPAATATPTPGSGGGTTTTTTTNTNTPQLGSAPGVYDFAPIDPFILSPNTGPFSPITGQIGPSGGDIIGPGFGISFPGQPNGQTLNFSINSINTGTALKTGGFAERTFGLLPPVPGGPAQFSPNGTLLDANFTDTNGAPVTTFQVPLQIVLKYNAADLAMAKGNASVLTGAYLIDALSPPIENPLHFPIGTWVFFAPSATTLNTTTGAITVTTQAVGSVVGVFTNPVGYVQTLNPDAPVLSSFDPASSQTFGTKSQFSYFQVVEPQIGTRLLVLDPDTGNYGYVNASDVGPSGAPAPKSAAAVVRGLRS